MAEIHNFSRKLRDRLSIFVSAIIIGSFIVPFYTSGAHALDIPRPILPIDYSETTSLNYPPLGVPSFTWSDVNGATKYRLQADSDDYFNSPLLNITTANTSYTPASLRYLFEDGEWFWRVRVEDPAPTGEWSDIMHFTKNWATDDNKPTLIAPDNDDVIAFFNSPGFSWTRVIGAAKYRVQIAESEDGFNDPLLSDDTVATSIQPNTRLENREYWWRVIPVDSVNNLGTPSEIWKFTMAYGTHLMDLVPTLLTPADESYPLLTPTFHWTAVEGAEHYTFEYTTEENNNCDFSKGNIINTKQTFYTPIDTFPNDVRYCWRVRVESGSAVGDYSDMWHFEKRWYLQPQLLTPSYQFENGLYPIYSWTPVPGASRYIIEISEDPDFNDIFEIATTANTFYSPQSKYIGTNYYYWRVTPIDGSGEVGLPNDPPWEYQSNYDSTAPILIYPFYYYQPNNYDELTMNPVEDRTIAYPVFIWHRVMNPTPFGGIFASAYRIQVDTTPNFNNILWEYDTENTSATPIDSDDFTPEVGHDYYWRVCVLDHIGGNCRTNIHSGWSQIWRARFDTSMALTPSNADAPVLLRPAYGQESVEATPLLEWFPFQDATETQYQVEISRDINFSTIEITETTNIPSYSPPYSLAQRSLGRTDYGTFYWRVRGYYHSSWSEWSEPWHFQIASQSEWRYTRSLGNQANQLLIGSDPISDTYPTYDLSSLYASQSNDFWFLGFNANLTSTDMTYVFYIDIDQEDESGASTPPERPYEVSTIPAHQPEFVIYVDKYGGIVDAQNTWVFAWDGINWGIGQKLDDIGGLIYAANDYVELQLPNTEIGMSQINSSISVILFSVDTSTGLLQDSVPSDAEVPGDAQVSRFSAVSEHMNLISPPNSASGDPTTNPSILPFYWDWPTGSNTSTPFSGIKLEVFDDPGFNNRVAEFKLDSSDPYFGENNVVLLNDINGDNNYYWRVQPRYWYPGFSPAFGSWTGGWSFRRSGFTAQNLQTSVNWATPTFSWDMAEGASSYLLQVSTVPDFEPTIINQTTPMTAFTPSETFKQGDYYWRVKVNRYDGVENGWSEVAQFSLSLPTPTGLTPDGYAIVHFAPTLCWDPLIKYNDDAPYEPILTAWKYKVEVSRDQNFSVVYDSITTNNNCWTPMEGYHDGNYWWHVAMIDGGNKMGSYSAPATFIKQYPTTSLISPNSGSYLGTPTFIWTPVDGSAAYRFEVSEKPDFSSLYDYINTINIKFTPTKLYESNTVYYWRVAIRDLNGRQGPYNEASFQIGGGIHIYLPLIGR
jgi:hypothetical protein